MRYVIKCTDLATKSVTYEDFDYEDDKNAPYSCFRVPADKKTPQEVTNLVFDSIDDACVCAQSLNEQEIEYANCNGVPVECMYQVVEIA